jgi:hypothetical protein
MRRTRASLAAVSEQPSQLECSRHINARPFLRPFYIIIGGGTDHVYEYFNATASADRERIHDHLPEYLSH